MKRIRVFGMNSTTTPVGAIKMAIVSFLVASLLLGGIMQLGGGESLEESVTWIEAGVESGDTLWSIIERSHVEQGVDTRTLIQLYKEKHGTTTVYAGQWITIPILENR